MRVRSVAVGLLVVAATLPACDDPPGGMRGAAVTFAGTSFAGEARLDAAKWIPTGYVPLPVYVEFEAAVGPNARLWLVIPRTVYVGPRTYACGTDAGAGMWVGDYCTIAVEETSDGATGRWTTFGVEVPGGGYGALPDCTITVTEHMTRFRGSFACAGLKYEEVTGVHPDAGNALDVSGTFDAAS